MALPVLSNDKPMYEVQIPSTQETFKFRPFLVKEQKSLLIAFESKDNKQILTTMLNCIESCVPGIDLNKLATFDLDYVFTQIRAKSVGEKSTILTKCIKCEEENKVEINLEDIKMEKAEIKSKVIPITDQINVQMKYPTYMDVLANPNISNDNSSEVEVLFDSIRSCLYAVQSGDDNIVISQEPIEEVDKFINSLTNQQLEKITQFVSNMPTLAHKQKFKCEKCGHENTLALKGLQDFF
tara:strand:- start:3 stop:719 length:717 start_codon:yes stop_codon:yes gene_type:complete